MMQWMVDSLETTQRIETTQRRQTEMDSRRDYASLSIEDVEVMYNTDGWGPTNGGVIPLFSDIPYAHFDKKTKITNAADFTAGTGYNNYKFDTMKYRRRGDENAEFSFKQDVLDDSTFQLVDTAKTSTIKSKYGAKKSYNQVNRGNNVLGNRNGRNQGGFDRNGKGSVDLFNRNSANRNSKNGGKFGRNFRRDRNKLERMPSLVVGGDWNMIEEFDLAQLLKLVANPPVVEDLVWCGHLDQYDDSFEKITTRTAKQLKRIENKIFYEVTTSDDPILANYAAEEIGNVFATDAILAHLMASPRSVYSWDIVVQKIGDSIYLDKRDNSVFDFLTVSETAHEPPISSDEIDEYNHPQKLSIEATMINQNFSQQVLKDDTDFRKLYEPNPFYDETDDSGAEPSSVAYRYRKFTLGNIKIIARCELHAWMPQHGIDQLMTVYSLNEWDSKYAGGVNWRQKIDQQRGAVLATELKNNSNKLAKWTAQSILAGADKMKVGYVSRVAPNNCYDHTILATQFFKPKELAQQINLSVNNIWGIIKMLSELLLTKDDGKYVIMKDPNKATVRVYSVPLNTFEEDEEEEEDVDEKTA
jgi:translation initiation factor 3 subunit D